MEKPPEVCLLSRAQANGTVCWLPNCSKALVGKFAYFRTEAEEAEAMRCQHHLAGL